MTDYQKKCLAIISKPFLKITEIAFLTQRSVSTVKRWLAKSGIERWEGFGFATGDIITGLHLEEFVSSLKAHQ